MNRTAIYRALQNVSNWFGRFAKPYSKDIRRELQQLALRSTAEFVKANLTSVQSVASSRKVHEFAISQVAVTDGLVLEFGVYSGDSVNFLAKKFHQPIYGFDSFEGLPESWRDGFGTGHFARSTLPRVRDNVHLIKGWFDESLPEFLLDESIQEKQVAYLHIDCDLYSSTKTIFSLLGSRIRTGTVIVFDEFFNYDGWERGEFMAFQEFVESASLRYEFLTYNRNHEQVSIRIL